MYKFEAFNIKSIPHIENSNIDMLTNVTSKNEHTHNKFSIELISRLSISDNNWRISNYNQYIMNFFHSEWTFSGSMVNDKQHVALL